jgi:pyrimidine deaminase RibD-like protein
MLNETHRAPPRYKISDFFSSLLEPRSKRKPPKISCAKRLIDCKVARVVFGMPDKDEDVYGFSSLAEAGIEIGLFPKDLMQELLALNKEWSDSRRSETDCSTQ